jgi:hypothetical protein
MSFDVSVGLPVQSPSSYSFTGRSTRRFSLFALCLLFLTGLANGAAFGQVQQGFGALSGYVTDSSKAAIPGAKVVLRNPSIGYLSTAITSGSGQFTFSPLTVAGGYILDVSAKGFSTASIKDLQTSVGTVISQNVTLAIGSESTVVEVTGTNEEQVQVDTSSISQLIDSTVWKDSPLETRDQNTFVGLVAGAAPDSAGTGRGFAINGARTGTGDFLADGYDNNDQGQGGAGTAGSGSGGAMATISPDAIQEFRVITSTPPAEYGRTGGFATDTVLKSGTNHIHGSAFEYNRNQAITANNYFSNTNGLIDHLVRNQFGGSVGAPIYKDKTFIYVSAEFQRLRQGQPSNEFVAVTPAFINFVKTGAFETFMEGTTQQDPTVGADPTSPEFGTVGIGACPANTGAACPGVLARSATLGPIFSQLLASEPSAFPLATIAVPGGEVAQGAFTSTNDFSPLTIRFPVQVYGLTAVTDTSSLNENRGSVKLDHKLSEHDQLSFTYLADLSRTSNNHGGGDSTPGVAYDQVGGGQLFGATYIHSFSTTLVNEFKGSFLRHVSNFDAPGTTGVPSTYTFDALQTGFGATSGFPQLFTENQFGYEDSISKTLGRHTIKAGFSFKRTRNGSSFYNDVNGTVSPWSVEGLLTDSQSDQDLDVYINGGSAAGGVAAASASLNPTTGLAPDPYRGFRANEFAAYGQDDFKASSRITLNYGLRWDYFGPPHNFQSGIDSNVYFGAFGAPTATGNPFLPNVPLAGATQGATFQLAQANGRSTIWNRDTNNFAPRVGFAVDTMGNQKFVVRGGFGIGYDRLYNNVYENIRFNAPFFVDNTQGLGNGQGPIGEDVRQALYNIPFTANPALAGTGAAVPRHIDQRLVTAYYEQAHLGVESALPKGFVLEADYVMTLGRKLVGLENINTFPGRDACPVPSAPYTAAVPGKPVTQGNLCFAAGYPNGFSTSRLSTAFGNDNFRTNGFSSNYSGGQLSIRKGYSNGLQVTANYTYSKAMDEVSDVFTIKSGATGISAPYNPKYDYGPADFDTKHLFVMTANYVSHSATHKLLLAGWGVSPILSLHSGTPVDIIDGSGAYSPNKDGSLGVQRASYLGTGSFTSSINHHQSPATGYITPGTWGSLACPLTVNQGLFCNPATQRNSIYGPSFYNVDLSASKHLTFRDHYEFTLQAAFFDLDNHPEFGNPVGNTSSGNFGQSTSAASRIGQLSGRVDF